MSAGLIVCVNLCVLWWAAAVSVASRQEEICTRCQCLPTDNRPTQAICTQQQTSTQPVFEPYVGANSRSLELIYVYSMVSVMLEEHSLHTDHPLTLLIHNCSQVHVSDNATEKLRTLIVREADNVKVGEQAGDFLSAVLLENIKVLEINSESVRAQHSVTIGRVESLTLLPSSSLSSGCHASADFTFLLFNSKVQSIPKTGLSLCGGGQITINGNIFSHIAEEGIQIMSEGVVAIVYNQFESVTKQAFNISAPEIHITKNNFTTLPEGALRGVSTFDTTFFTSNTIEDIDLGGVLLDMGWDMTIEENIIHCDCSSRRTSILNPNEDMIYLTNSSLEKLEIIFLNNFCNTNCTVTLKDFSEALTRSEVCITNETVLEEYVLCPVITTIATTVDTTYETESISTMSTSDQTEEVSTSSASGTVETIIPMISIVLIAVLVSCSLIYGIKEINSFKYKFNPQEDARPKILAE